jgi:polyisoprenyl-teichoic acid--peptidoglycan teichoic acid transferase
MRAEENETRRSRRARSRRLSLSLILVVVGLALGAGAYGLVSTGTLTSSGSGPAQQPDADRNSFVSRDAPPAPEADETADEEKQSSEDAPEPSAEATDVLVLGVDKRPDGYVEGTGTRSDTMMVVRLVPATGEIRLLSIPRDLLVEISPGWRDRINSSYAYYGLEGATRAVEGATGVRIDHHAVVDFEGFEDVIDAIGGVKLVAHGEFPESTRIEGGEEQRLNGRKALLYARYRGTEGGDLDRIERQQQMVAALRDRALRWHTLTKLPEIAGVVMRNVETDVGFGETLSLGRALASHGREEIETYRLTGTPDVMENGNEVLVPDEAANEEVLEKFRR